jgi:hypothetical protein
MAAEPPLIITREGQSLVVKYGDQTRILPSDIRRAKMMDLKFLGSKLHIRGSSSWTTATIDSFLPLVLEKLSARLNLSEEKQATRKIKTSKTQPKSPSKPRQKIAYEKIASYNPFVPQAPDNSRTVDIVMGLSAKIAQLNITADAIATSIDKPDGASAIHARLVAEAFLTYEREVAAMLDTADIGPVLNLLRMVSAQISVELFILENYNACYTACEDAVATALAKKPTFRPVVSRRQVSEIMSATALPKELASIISSYAHFRLPKSSIFAPPKIFHDESRDQWVLLNPTTNMLTRINRETGDKALVNVITRIMGYPIPENASSEDLWRIFEEIAIKHSTDTKPRRKDE